MKVKACPVAIKAPGGNENTGEGVFEAFVATYDVDSVGDRIVPGAFKKTIETWEGSGSPIPVVWAHQSSDPWAHIGHVTKASETPNGLKVEGQLDLENPMARQVYRMLKGRRVTNFSFAYDEIDARPVEQKDASGAKKELHELKVYEVGPCLVGANQATSLVGVKHEPTPTEAIDDVPAVGQVCESCGGPGHVACFDEKTAELKTSDAVAAMKAGDALSKEHVEALTGLLVDIAGKAQILGDIIDVLAGSGIPSDAGEKATPAQPVPAPPIEARSEPARHGTASVTDLSDRVAAALIEGDLVVDHY